MNVKFFVVAIVLFAVAGGLIATGRLSIAAPTPDSVKTFTTEAWPLTSGSNIWTLAVRDFAPTPAAYFSGVSLSLDASPAGRFLFNIAVTCDGVGVWGQDIDLEISEGAHWYTLGWVSAQLVADRASCRATVVGHWEPDRSPAGCEDTPANHGTPCVIFGTARLHSYDPWGLALVAWGVPLPAPGSPPPMPSGPGPATVETSAASSSAPPPPSAPIDILGALTIAVVVVLLIAAVALIVIAVLG